MKTYTRIAHLLLLLLLLPILCFAKNIPKERAARLATTFFSSAIKHENLDLSAGISNIQTLNSEGVPVLYVVNFRDGGYVITPTNDLFYPVLAYSFESSFSETVLPPNMQSWIDWYSHQITAGINNPDQCFQDCARLWNNFPEGGMDDLNFTTGVEPMLTNKWNQMDYYNEMCPADPDGYAGHTPVGCVATALSQLMYYYRFPPVGNGSYTYTPEYGDGIYGEQFADFGSTWYRWDEMQDQCFESNLAVAELCHHCGVSVNMEYQSGNAGASTADVPNALINYFNYSPSAYFQDRTELDSTAQWLALLMESLDNRQPVLYRSTNGWSGHAYVCDGYQDSLYYHFNWGWAGNYNGYFYIDELIPGGLNLTWGQGAVFDIYPDTLQFEYPVYCDGPKVMASKFGTIEDGSGPDDYRSNTSCSWLIQPADTTLTNILLDFSFLDTEAGEDIISIYDGPSAEAELLGEYGGNEIPGTIYGSSEAVFITFQSGTEIQYRGWKLSYYAYRLPFCDEIFVVNDKDGMIDDGSNHLSYASYTDCSWLIAPEVPITDSVDRIRLHFDLFSVAPDDTLFIYDGENETMPLLGKFSGWNQPEEISTGGNKVFLNFRTNGGNNGPGWEISYYSVNPDYCQDTVFLTEQSGTIEDGSGEKNYVENTECYWMIEVPNGEFIVLDFMEVDLEENYDFVKVFDMNDLTYPVERVTGHSPWQPFTIYSNRVLLQFFTDDRDNFSGWKMTYHASVEGVPNKAPLSALIYPNPCTNQLSISTEGLPAGLLIFELLDLNCGTIIRDFITKSTENINLEHLDPGVYLLKFGDGQEWYYRKIIKL